MAISTDTVYALRVFAAALGGFPFPLLGDRAQAVSRAFGILDPERGNARRSTFVIAHDGTVRFANTAFSASDPAHYEAVVSSLK